MISANNVTLRIGKKALFEDVNIKFTEGNCYGLIGANGAGKSTFLKILSGQLEPTGGDVTITPGQRLSFLQQDHFKYDEYTVLDTVIMGNKRLYDIMKEKDAIYMKEDFTDEDGIRASELEAEFADMDGWNAESDAATLLNGLGIPTEEHYTQMGDMPGPLKVKVLLAQALFGNPDILLLDEPTNHLDFATLGWLEDYLAGYKGALLVVSHDRYFLDKLCNKIWELEDATLWEYKGNYTAYTKQREEQATRQKKLYEQQQEERAKLEDYVARNLVRASTTKMAQSRQKMLERLEPVGKLRRRLKPPKIRLAFETEPVKDVLIVDDLTVTVGSGEKERMLLTNAEFNIQRGDKVAIIGPNGSGKTTLLRTILSAEPPEKGRITWGRGVKRSYYDQGSDHLDQSLTVMDTMWKAYPRMYETPLRTALGAMGLTGEDAYRLVGQLSGGERARLKLAIICLAGSNVLVLDEPTNHLDLPSKEVLQQALSEYEGTLIIVSHDRYLLDRVPNRIFAIEQGMLHQYKGGYSAYLKAKAEQGTEKAAELHLKTESEQKKQYYRGKEQRREDARRRKEYTETETAIHTLESELEQIRSEMAQDSIQNDYQRLQELCAQIEEKQDLLDMAMERWLILSEEMGN